MRHDAPFIGNKIICGYDFIAFVNGTVRRKVHAAACIHAHKQQRFCSEILQSCMQFGAGKAIVMPLDYRAAPHVSRHFIAQFIHGHTATMILDKHERYAARDTVADDGHLC